METVALGRPTVMTPEVIAKLEDGFSMGYTDDEACLWAGIGSTALYDYCKVHKDLAERKEMLKRKPNMIAKKTTIPKLAEDAAFALSWLKAADKDFQPDKGDKEKDKPLTVNVIQHGISGERIQTEVVSGGSTPST